MLCDEYKDALIEAAAGAAVPAELREHVGACTQCRTAMDMQQTLFALVDAGLRSRTNARVPGNFDHRVRAALEIQAPAVGRSYSLVFAFASMTAAVAVMLAILLTHTVNQGRKEKPSRAVEQAELPVSKPRTAQSPAKEPQQSSGPLRSRGSISDVAERSNGAGRGSNDVMVLVPEGQEALLVKYMEGIAAARPRVIIGANLQHEPEMKPVGVSPVEISALVVKPLPDLSSN
jgi:hypothetical protein